MKNRFKNWLNKDPRPFAPGMCFSKMFIIFVLGCMLGVYYEELLSFIKHHHATGEWFWPCRKGVIYGPFNPLYGAGITFIILLLNRKKRHPLKTLFLGALLGGFIEYVVSFLLEALFGVASWNYDDRLLNINGRTTIPYMFFWGFAIMILIHLIYPFLSKLIEKIPSKIGRPLVIFLVIFMSLDMFISFTALARQTLRHKGYEPLTFVGEFYDKVYTDEYLKKVYTNMKFIK